jgi:hypothetical protein
MSKGTAVLRNSWFTNGKLIPACTPIKNLEQKPSWDMIVYVDENLNIIGEEPEPKQEVKK